MEWVDEFGTLQWIVPLQGNERLLGVKPNVNATCAETMQRAMETMKGQLTEPVDLLQGGKGFLYMSPVSVKGKYNGNIVTAFTLDDIFTRIVARSGVGAFYLTASEDGIVFFTNAPLDFHPDERWQKNITFKMRDKDWAISVNPSPEMLARKNSPLPDLVLSIGLLTAFFATFSILLAIRSRRAEAIVRSSEDKLRQIVVNHSILASADFDLRRFMQEAVDSLHDLTPATGAVIEIIDGDEMVYEATAGSVVAFKGMRIDRVGSLSGRCVDQRQIFMAQDTANDPNVNAEACRKVGAASMAIAPLIQRGKVVGVLKILSSVAFAFSPQDVQTLELTAGLIGGALGQQMEIERREKLEEQLHAWHIMTR